MKTNPIEAIRFLIVFSMICIVAYKLMKSGKQIRKWLKEK